MALTIKLATCCYCGAKSTLALCGASTRTLTCEQCSAPLSRLKFIKKVDAAPGPTGKTAKRKSLRRPPAQARSRDEQRRRPLWSPRKKRKAARGPRRFTRLLAELFDEFEDLFD